MIDRVGGELRIKGIFFFITLLILMIITNIAPVLADQSTTGTTVGQQLTSPDPGWQRIDNIDTHFTFNGSWRTETGTAAGSSYNSTVIWTSSPTASINFKFYGTELRIISNSYNDCINAPVISVKVDGVEKLYNRYSSTRIWQVLQTEFTGLTPGIHNVEITAGTTMDFDAIDIDSTGYLVNSNVPSTVTGLTLSNNNLIWTANPSTENIINYKIYDNGTLLGTSSANNYSMANLIQGNHSLQVSAVNSYGEGPLSNVLNYNRLGIPAAPTGLQISKITINSFDLSFNLNQSSDQVQGYKIYLNGNQYGSEITSSPTSITGLNPNTQYTVAMTALNVNGESQQSSVVKVITLGPPATPNGLSAGNITSNSFTLYWINQSDATSYNVYMDGTLVGNVSQPLFYNPSFDFNNLTEGSTHIITVTAINQWGESVASQPLIVTATIPNPVLKANIDNSSIKLSWIGIGNSFDIIVDGNQVEHVSNSPYTLTDKPGTYQIQVIQNYNGQQYPSNVLSVKVSALQNVGAAQMTSDILSSTGTVIVPAGGLLALALAIKGSPMLLAAARSFFLNR